MHLVLLWNNVLSKIYIHVKDFKSIDEVCLWSLFLQDKDIGILEKYINMSNYEIGNQS